MRSPISTKGFTLTEILVAVSVSAYMISIAFAALLYTSKAVKRGEELQSRSAALQHAILWYMSGRAASDLDPRNGVRTAVLMTPGASVKDGALARVLNTTATVTSATGTSLAVDKAVDWRNNQQVVAFNPAAPTTGYTLPVTITGRTTDLRTFTGTFPTVPAATWVAGRVETFFLPPMQNELP